MKNKHLIDSEIQQFAFDESECEKDVVEHMSSCSLCKQRVEDYVLLSTSIKSIPDPALGFDLSKRVLMQLETSSKKKPLLDYFVYALITLSGLLVGFCVACFSLFCINWFKGNSTVSMAFIICIALSILMILINDIMKSHRRKMKMLKF
ncbi:hypothetical protein FEE95_10715 [Maribacter algarum]|uniref:Zinc-finger domain-containing protein n=1 Tax=Maribacter algarum (ex Zhang et al. 2020) TaxID=2578118 RepID=A0A5S3PQD4_9FLAO|nr:hypothetical protein [Maribacter algarum]TMM56957.1 hypothetical protein FEE95_10715 [Maribacter algarum]